MEFEVIHLTQTDSTNHWLREHSSDGNVIVWTDYQTAGKGCGTNTWESQKGENLLFSMLCHPREVPVSQQFALSEAIALTLHGVLCRLLPDKQVSVKWPNDIYVDNRKIAGILIENRLRGNVLADCIIGVGLNVNQDVFLSDAPNPVSLRMLTGQTYDRATLLHDIATAFKQEYRRCGGQEQHFDYVTRLYRNEGFHAFRDAEGTFEAELETVETDGHLILRDRQGLLRRYAFKEVEHCR